MKTAFLILFLGLIFVFLIMIIIGAIIDYYQRKETKNKIYSPCSNRWPPIVMVFFILFFALPKSVFASTYDSISSSSNCVQATINTTPDNQAMLMVYQSDPINATNQNGYKCFWAGGTLYIGYDVGNWGASVSDSLSPSDVIKCVYEDGYVKAYRNDVLKTQMSLSNYSSGSYIGSYVDGSTHSNISSCGSPPTPTPTTTITPTPTTTITPTPSTTISPTPTTTLTPTPTGGAGQYLHEYCFTPVSYSNSSGSSFNPITSYHDVERVSFGAKIDASALDLSSLQAKNWYGWRYYVDVTADNFSDETGAFRMNGQPFEFNTLESEFQPTIDDVVISELDNPFLCNGYTELHQFSSELDYWDFFDETGASRENLAWRFFMGHGNGAPPSYTFDSELSSFNVCLIYSDDNSSNQIRTDDVCNTFIPPDPTLVCTLTFENGVLSGVGDYTSCLFNKWRAGFISIMNYLFVPTSDQITGLSELISDQWDTITEPFNSDLASIISKPLTMIETLSTQTCQPFSLYFSPWDMTLNLPCPREYADDYFPTILSLWDVISTGLISYWVIVKILGIVKKGADPEDDKIEVTDI